MTHSIDAKDDLYAVRVCKSSIGHEHVHHWVQIPCTCRISMLIVPLSSKKALHGLRATACIVASHISSLGRSYEDLSGYKY